MKPKFHMVDSLSKEEKFYPITGLKLSKWLAYVVFVLFCTWGVWTTIRWHDDKIKQEVMASLAEQARKCMYTFVIDRKGETRCAALMPVLRLPNPTKEPE